MTYRFPLLWMLWVSFRPCWFARRDEEWVQALERRAAREIETAHQRPVPSQEYLYREGDPLVLEFKALEEEVERREHYERCQEIWDQKQQMVQDIQRKQSIMALGHHPGAMQQPPAGARPVHGFENLYALPITRPSQLTPGIGSLLGGMFR